MICAAGWRGDPPLKVLCGGEEVTRDLANRLTAASDSVWNLYGPTETTIWSAAHRVGAGEGHVPIGLPIANTQFHIVDASMDPVPDGEPGELLIGGDGLARGYRHKPESTAARFIPDAFRSDGGRLYRTGDCVRLSRDGALLFLGRMDRQIKVRGFRVEPGEIVSALMECKGIEDAAVTAAVDATEEKYLIGYMVSGSPTRPSHSELREQLRSRLPEYMVPSAFVFLDKLPLSPAGKVDYRALPKVASANAEQSMTPRTSTERLLAPIWSEVLRAPVGIHDNFFSAGGHSLIAALIAARVEAATSYPLTVRDVLDHPSISAVSALIDSGSSPVVRPAVRKGAIQRVRRDWTRSPEEFPRTEDRR
jgi:hypothetical protein